MSSMLRYGLASLCLATALTSSVPLVAQDGAAAWDQARASLVATQPGPMAGAIARWEALAGSPSFSFADYSSFLLSYPGFPDESRLRGYAEAKLQNEYAPPERLVAYFDRFPPLGNAASAY
jgi:soluble lytic murein transglycosylase